MPVDYTIASRNALANTPTDFTNMMAQYQMMGARAQQQQLAQMQMDEYARKAQAEQALRGLTPNFDDPRFAQQAFQYDPDMARNFYLARLRGQNERASTGESQTRTNLALRKFEEIDLPEAEIRKEKLDFERQVERRRVQEQLAKADAASLYLLGKRTEMAQNILSRMDETNYPDLKEEAAKFDPSIGKQLGETYSQKQISTYLNTAESLRKQVEEERKRRNEYEFVDVVNPKTGLKEKVAVPKYAPEKGGKAIAGTEGLATGGRIQTQTFPSVPGAVLQSDESGNSWLAYPAQPGQRPVTTGMPVPLPAPGQPKQGLRVDMNAPPGAPQNAGMIGIRSAAPLGSPERGRQDVMQQILTAGAYNPDTGVDLIEPTLGRASSGMLSAKGTDISRKFGRDSAAARADTDLKRISADLTQAFAGNRLATAGVAASEADRFEKQAGDIGNSNLTIGERLNAYRSIKRNATRLLGVDYKNPYDPQGIKTENVMRQRVEESPNGFTVTDPDGGTHTFGDRKQAAEFLSHIQRMEVGKR